MWKFAVVVMWWGTAGVAVLTVVATAVEAIVVEAKETKCVVAKTPRRGVERAMQTEDKSLTVDWETD
jgi:hypothetical protein